MVLILVYQTWNHQFRRKILSELRVLFLKRTTWNVIYNDCYFALLFLPSLSPVAAFFLFLLSVMKPEHEWEKFICNAASPAVSKRESLWLLFPPMGSLWMTISALRETVSLADHMQSLGNPAQNFPKLILLTSNALGQTVAPSPGDEGLQHLFQRLFLAGFLMNSEIGAWAFFASNSLFAQRTHGAPARDTWPSDLACKSVKYMTRNQL